jgi:hypothetical protein
MARENYRKLLQNKIDSLNFHKLGTSDPWDRTDPKDIKLRVGAFMLEGYNGGYRVTVNVPDPHCGAYSKNVTNFGSAREVFNLFYAWLDGHYACEAKAREAYAALQPNADLSIFMGAIK